MLESGLHAVDYGFQALESGSFSVELRFWIPTTVFRNPRPRIPNFTGKISRIPLPGGKIDPWPGSNDLFKDHVTKRNEGRWG